MNALLQFHFKDTAGTNFKRGQSKNTNKHQTPWQNFEAYLLTMVDEGIY